MGELPRDPGELGGVRGGGDARDEDGARVGGTEVGSWPRVIFMYSLVFVIIFGLVGMAGKIFLDLSGFPYVWAIPGAGVAAIVMVVWLHRELMK